MFAQSRPHAPAIGHLACRFPAALGLCLALLAGCSTAPPPVAGVHPADPQAPSRPAAYRPVVGPYTSQRPLEPSGWRENNERVAPRDKP